MSDGRVDPVAEIQASAPERPIRQRPCGPNTWWGICLPSRQEVDDGSSATVAGRGPRSHRGQPGRPRHPATRDSARLGGRAGVASLLREGLSVEDAAARLESAGPNELPTPHGPSLPRQLAEQLIHFFALMLWVAAGLAFVGGMPALGVAIVVVIVVNGAFSFLQEYRAERAVRALSALLPETVVVRRGGRKRTVPAAELVPGDIVLLKEGDRISADARVIRSSELKVDMSTLTGESEPIPRASEPVAHAPADPLEAPNVVFAGTFVVSGSGTAVVVATGGGTRLGGISTLTGQVVRRATPLRLQLNRAVGLIADVRRRDGHRVLRRRAGARDAGSRRLPVLGRGDRGARAGRTPADTVPLASDERHAHGARRSARPPTRVRRDARFDDGHLLGQDRDDHDEPDDGPCDRAVQPPLHGDRVRLRAEWHDPVRAGPAAHR